MSTKRHIEIDFIRGLSLLGVFVVNACLMNTAYWKANKVFSFLHTDTDVLVNNLLHSFAIHKFLPLFAILFGMSISLSNYSIKKLTIRSSVLLLFGSLHAIFVFWGDILFIYGILSLLLFILLKIFKNKEKNIFWLLFLLTSFFRVYSNLHSVSYNFLGDQESIYLNPSFFEISWSRLHIFYYFNFWGFFEGTINDILLYLSSFLEVFCLIFGGYLFKDNILSIINRRKLSMLIYTSVIAICLEMSLYGDFILKTFLFVFSYIIIFSYLFKLLPKLLVERIVSFGRMSLTHYVLFNLTCSFLLYGYGLGLYSKVGPSLICLFALVYFFIMLFFGQIYWRRFHIGPLEFVMKKILDKGSI